MAAQYRVTGLQQLPAVLVAVVRQRRWFGLVDGSAGFEQFAAAAAVGRLAGVGVLVFARAAQQLLSLVLLDETSAHLGHFARHALLARVLFRDVLSVYAHTVYVLPDPAGIQQLAVNVASHCQLAEGM